MSLRLPFAESILLATICIMACAVPDFCACSVDYCESRLSGWSHDLAWSDALNRTSVFRGSMAPIKKDFFQVEGTSWDDTD